VSAVKKTDIFNCIIFSVLKSKSALHVPV